MQSVVWALFRGDFAEAERLAEEAAAPAASPPLDADCSYRLAMFVLRREQGRLEEIEALIRDAVDAYPGYRSFRCFVPLLELELGRDGRGAPRVRPRWRTTVRARCPRDGEWLFCLCLLAEVAAAPGATAGRRRCSTGCCAVRAGQRDGRGRGRCRARSRASSDPCSRPCSGGPDEAAAHFEDAIAIERADRRPARGSPTRRRLCPHAARARQSRRRRSGRAPCTPPTVATYRELGMRPAQAAIGRTATPAAASASLTWAIE